MYAAAEIILYNRGNRSKNNRTYPTSDFGSMEDIVAVVLHVCNVVHITLCISRHAPASHVISESRYKFSVRGSAFSTSPTLPNVSVTTIKSCTGHAIPADTTQFGEGLDQFLEGAPIAFAFSSQEQPTPPSEPP